MKARVIATGDIIEISEDCSYLYAEHYDRSYNLNELEFLDVKGNSFPKDDPDYWTRLEHQYAGMAMQGILACEEWKISPRKGVSFAGEVALQAQEIAHALVEKMKEERKG